MVTLQFRPIVPSLALLPGALATTLGLSALAVAIGFGIALGMVTARLARRRWLRVTAITYVEIMRNTPLIALLYLAYFGLPRIGLRTGGFGSALLALSLNAGAYLAEILRAGLLAVPRGQHDAAASLGLSAPRAFGLVVMPQVMRIVWGPVGNVVIQVLLGSSLASVVAVNEVADWMQNVGSDTFRYFETFLVAALVYLVLCQGVNGLRLALGRLLFPSPA